MLPPRRILAAIDFSPGSRVALAFAGRLAKQCGAELHVLHASPPGPPEAGGESREAAALAQDLSQQLHPVSGASETTPPDGALFHIVRGDTADVIIHVATRERADVIVLGTRGSHHAATTAPGSTLATVLERSTVPVLAIPHTWTPPSAERDDLQGVGPVIAALNMTCPAIEGAAAASRLAAALHARLVLLHALPPSPGSGTPRASATGAVTSVVDLATEDVVRVATALRAQSPVPSELVFETGDVCSVLTAAARQSPRALLVLGRGIGPHAYGPPCAIATRLIRSSPVPVLLYIGQ